MAKSDGQVSVGERGRKVRGIEASGKAGSEQLAMARKKAAVVGEDRGKGQRRAGRGPLGGGMPVPKSQGSMAGTRRAGVRPRFV